MTKLLHLLRKTLMHILTMAYEKKGLTYKALEYYYLYSGLESDAGVLSVVEQKIKKLEAK